MTPDPAKNYVEHWQRVGPILLELEQQELRDYTAADRGRDIQALLSMPLNYALPDEPCGLLEQQRLFALASR